MVYQIHSTHPQILLKIPINKPKLSNIHTKPQLQTRTTITSSSSPSISISTVNHENNPKQDIYSVKFKTLGACKLGISRYPDFEYNAQGGEGSGIGKKMVGVDFNGETSVDFDVKTLYIPPLTTATTKFLGLPLPPFLKIAIVPEIFRGIINLESGKGLYEENVEIPSYKTNIVLLGEGSDMTMITGNRSVMDGWTTFRSATVAVSGEGFLARDIGFHNLAGPEKHQAVALRINADLAAVYRCSISSYQDTLYAHSFRQFYRECDIYGTIDYIFGNAAVVFQGCNLISRMPMPGQFTVISAQSRDSPDQQTGISFQNCSILATEDLLNSTAVKSYLGRPWRPYSRTVFMESYMDDFIDPKGWIPWSGDGDDEGLETLYYGEYENVGPGSEVEGRVTWAGHHVMDYYEASNFTVSEFITGQEWLDSTSFPYDDGV